jgi:hypothetical protein
MRSNNRRKQVATIHITVNTEVETLDEVLGLFDFIRRPTVLNPVWVPSDKEYDPNAWKTHDELLRQEHEAIPPKNSHPVEKRFETQVMTDAEGAKVVAGAVLSDMDGNRKRGEPAPGHRRRTNVQIESDRLWMEQKARGHAALAEMDKGIHDHEAPISRAEAEATAEMDAFDAAQDAEDEAAETAARPATDAPTIEDLRAAVARYSAKAGPAATVANIRGIIGCAMIEVPADKIGEAIAKVDLATAGFGVIMPNSPADDKPVETESLFGGTPAAPPTATPAEVLAAIMAYARRYDGQDTDQEKMAFTKQDLPKVFSETFGAAVTGLGSLPDKTPETYGKALAAIKAATEANRFGRGVQ